MPRQFVHKRHDRLLAKIAVIATAAAVAAFVSLASLRSTEIHVYGAIIAGIAFLLAWYWLLRVNARYVLDDHRLIVISPDILFRRGRMPMAEVYPYALCQFYSDKPDASASKVMLTRIDSARVLQIPTGLLDFKEMLAHLRMRMYENHLVMLPDNRIEFLLDKKLTLRYGGPNPGGSSAAGLGVAGAVLSMAGGPIGGFASQFVLQFAGEGISAVSRMLTGLFGPRIQFEKSEFIYQSPFHYMRVPYRDVRRCRFERRWAREALLVDTDHDSVPIYTSLSGFDFVLRALRLKCAPDVWGKARLPWELPIKSNAGFTAAAAFFVVTFVSGVLIGIAVERYPTRWTGFEWKLLSAIALPTAAFAYLYWRRRLHKIVFTENQLEIHRSAQVRTVRVDEIEAIVVGDDEGSAFIEIREPGNSVRITKEECHLPMVALVDSLRTIFPGVPIVGSRAVGLHDKPLELHRRHTTAAAVTE